jgi:hypothetical protein
MINRFLPLVVLCLAFLPSVSRAGSQSMAPQPTFEWSSPGEVRLRDGRILILGSWTISGPAGLANTVVLFDPKTRQRTTVSPSAVQQCDGTPILLNDGRVLIVGGVQCLPFAMLQAGQHNSRALRLAQIFDPASLTFSATGNLNETRLDPGVILLNNGQVLVVGGSATFSAFSVRSCELYDPATGIFTKTGIMHRMVITWEIQAAPLLSWPRTKFTTRATVRFNSFNNLGGGRDIWRREPSLEPRR